MFEVKDIKPGIKVFFDAARDEGDDYVSMGFKVSDEALYLPLRDIQTALEKAFRENVTELTRVIREIFRS